MKSLHGENIVIVQKNVVVVQCTQKDTLDIMQKMVVKNALHLRKKNLVICILVVS